MKPMLQLYRGEKATNSGKVYNLSGNFVANYRMASTFETAKKRAFWEGFVAGSSFFLGLALGGILWWRFVP